jgi:hypothetical protein
MGRYWRLVGVAVFLHAIADPAVTVLAVSVLERGVEANPFIRWQLAGPPQRLIVWHLGLIGVALTIFWALARLLQLGEPADRRRAYQLSIIGLWLLIGWGLLLVAQALTVIIDA